jgi:hypothetical protein
MGVEPGEPETRTSARPWRSLSIGRPASVILECSEEPDGQEGSLLRDP